MMVSCWMVEALDQPMVASEREAAASDGQVLIEVAGCGVCHTDLGFYYDKVPTKHPLPLTLGHEIAGTVVEAGAGAEAWIGKQVIVPAVIPCGHCPACRDGHASICPSQIFPGNDVHGGFATHLVVPADGLCPVPDLSDSEINAADHQLADLSVIADAVSTPYQAVLRSGLQQGDLAIFLGVGGVGGFGAQIAAALGAKVVAIDIDDGRLERLSAHGPELSINSRELDFRALKKSVRAFAGDQQIPSWRWKIFETSGTPQGQATAFGLLGHGSYLSVVGYTPAKTEIRLSNLMALHASAEGNWGCTPDHYPAVLDLVLSGKVHVKPYIEHRPLSSINETFQALHAGQMDTRPVLIPER